MLSLSLMKHRTHSVGVCMYGEVREEEPFVMSCRVLASYVASLLYGSGRMDGESR